MCFACFLSTEFDNDCCQLRFSYFTFQGCSHPFFLLFCWLSSRLKFKSYNLEYLWSINSAKHIKKSFVFIFHTFHTLCAWNKPGSKSRRVFEINKFSEIFQRSDSSVNSVTEGGIWGSHGWGTRLLISFMNKEDTFHDNLRQQWWVRKQYGRFWRHLCEINQQRKLVFL